jgi:ATP-dependent exoDNAse (exonuclease V) beta subunit
VEIEALGERPEVQDVLMLARALTHLGDRVAWLAVLRAPWCGLLLADLLHLADAALPAAPVVAEGAPAPTAPPPAEATLWSRLTHPDVTAGLSSDGRARAERLVAALAPALAGRGRRPLRRWVEGAWLALGSPACVPPAAWPNVEACLARLEGLPPERAPQDAEAFAELLERLFAAPHPAADPRLQVLSIHKAKGLQFDTVIVPGLGRVPRRDESPLLRWFERPAPPDPDADVQAGAGLLLAPIHEVGPDRDPVYDFLAGLERERAHHETGRLLYVAATRARRALHLSGHAVLKDGDLRDPPAHSLLARLWPAVAPDFEAAAQAAASGTAQDPTAAATETARSPAGRDPVGGGTLRRLRSGWRAPSPPPGVQAGAAAPPAAAPAEELAAAHAVEFRWAGEAARHVGTVVHRLLRQIARHGPGRWQAGAGAFAAPAIDRALAALGLAAAELPAARARVLEALERTLADERGRWVLAAHAEARSEYALTGWVAGRAAHFVIDRTFVDAQGVRWIVDFKTGSHEGGDPAAFLAREQERYRAQLEGYAALLSRADPGRPIRLALYFPLLQAWREWPAPAEP